jgi:Uma2 family endonuclease
MSATVRHRIMSIEDFLAWEARQETKYEFDGFEPVAMVGGSFAHALIQQNLALSVGNRLRGGPCRFLGSDLKVVTGSRARYPDGQILCGALDSEARFSTVPVVLFEVTSPDSKSRDYGPKLREYRGISSVRRYVILEQDRIAVTIHERTGESWTVYPLAADGVLALPEVGIELPIGELYEGVELTAID